MPFKVSGGDLRMGMRYGSGAAVIPGPTRAIPLTQTLYIGAKTLPGHGIWLNLDRTVCTPTATLSLVSSSGNFSTMYRINGCNQLVRGGQVTFGAVTNGGVAHTSGNFTIINNTPAAGTLAGSYTCVVQVHDAGQPWDGQQSAITVINNTIADLPAWSIKDPTGTYTYNFPAFTVNWANAYSLSPLPDGTVFNSSATDDYINYQNMVFDSGYQDPFKISARIGFALGDVCVLEGGYDWNPPIDKGNGGTEMFRLLLFCVSPSGTWSGTAPEYNDAPWMVYAMKDPVNTVWGQYNIEADTFFYTRFTHCNFNIAKAHLMNLGGGNIQDNFGSSDVGTLHFGIDTNFVKVDHCAFSCKLPAGETSFDDGNCFNGIMTVPSDDNPPYYTNNIILTDNVQFYGERHLHIKGSDAHPVHDVVIMRNFVTGLHLDDCFHTENTYKHTVMYNVSIAPNSLAGAHPDHYQFTFNNPADGTYAFGTFSRNVLLCGNVGINPATGLPAYGFRQRNDIAAQGFFFDGASSTKLRDGAIVQGNFIDGNLVNSIALGGFSNALIDHNTVVRDQSCDYDLVGSGSVTYPQVVLNLCSNVTVTNNIMAGPISQISPVNAPTLSNNFTMTQTQFVDLTPFFVNPTFGGFLMDKITAMANYATKAGNSSTAGQGTGGTDIGCYNQAGGYAV